MTVRWLVLASWVVAAACGGKLDSGTDGGGGDASTTGVCCPPSTSPGCCMSFGGWSSLGTCGAACDGMPTPDTPGWKQLTDAHGCKYWQQPANATSFCGGVLVDASPPPPACPTPADVSTFTPPAFVPPAVHKGACTSQQIQDLYVACFASSAPATTCQAFQQSNPGCMACVMTPPSSPGPMVQQSASIVTLNVAGCVAIVTSDSSPTGCAARVQANLDCEGAACDAQCPVVDAQSLQLYEQCTQSAETGGCSTYAQAQCALDGGLGQCAVPDFKTGYFDIVPLFCGP
ncbi:MAG TPA: hypothetical protein VLM85_19240 [Polyangiaceae bacterium]|nr:hypothetical protein [Polyangiaceae bacterium]